MLARLSSAARSVRGQLRDRADLRAAREPSSTAYAEINALFLRIIKETGVRPEYLWGSLHGAFLAKEARHERAFARRDRRSGRKRPRRARANRGISRGPPRHRDGCLGVRHGTRPSAADRCARPPQPLLRRRLSDGRREAPSPPAARRARPRRRERDGGPVPGAPAAARRVRILRSRSLHLDRQRARALPRRGRRRCSPASIAISTTSQVSRTPTSTALAWPFANSTTNSSTGRSRPCTRPRTTSRAASPTTCG